jgi:hypothetical protein
VGKDDERMALGAVLRFAKPGTDLSSVQFKRASMFSRGYGKYSVVFVRAAGPV